MTFFFCMDRSGFGLIFVGVSILVLLTLVNGCSKLTVDREMDAMALVVFGIMAFAGVELVSKRGRLRSYEKEEYLELLSKVKWLCFGYLVLCLWVRGCQYVPEYEEHRWMNWSVLLSGIIFVSLLIFPARSIRESELQDEAEAAQKAEQKARQELFEREQEIGSLRSDLRTREQREKQARLEEEADSLNEYLNEAYEKRKEAEYRSQASDLGEGLISDEDNDNR